MDSHPYTCVICSGAVADGHALAADWRDSEKCLNSKGSEVDKEEGPVWLQSLWPCTKLE